MKAPQNVSIPAYSPNALEVLCHAFDEAWEDVADNFAGNALAVRAGRLKLANIIFEVGGDGSNGWKQIKIDALNKMARDLRTGAR